MRLFVSFFLLSLSTRTTIPLIQAQENNNNINNNNNIKDDDNTECQQQQLQKEQERQQQRKEQELFYKSKLALLSSQSSSRRLSSTLHSSEETSTSTSASTSTLSEYYQQRELQEGVRIVAQYKHGSSIQGRQAIYDCAKTILRDEDFDDIVILTGNGSCMDTLLRNSNIEQVDFDYPIYPLVVEMKVLLEEESSLQEEKEEEENLMAVQDEDDKEYRIVHHHQQQLSLSGFHHPTTATGRKLDEEIPWGIQMIQADHLQLHSSTSSSSSSSSSSATTVTADSASMTTAATISGNDNQNNNNNNDNTTNNRRNDFKNRLRGNNNNNGGTETTTQSSSSSTTSTSESTAMTSNTNTNTAVVVASGENENEAEDEFVICIADTGIAVDHPDLDPGRTSGRFTGTNRLDHPTTLHWDEDYNGHGTHIGGIVGAMAGNTIGVQGALYASSSSSSSSSSPLFRIHSTRALDNSGYGYEWTMREAIQQCIDANAKIINLSLGSEEISYSANRFYYRIVNQMGIMLIAAAGNTGSDISNTAPIYPAFHPNVIAVSSVNHQGQLAGHSSFGNQIELAGPGLGILSTGVIPYTIQVVQNGNEEILYPTYYAIQPSSSSSSSSLPQTVTGVLIDCGDGSRTCRNVPSSEGTNFICFMIRSEESLLEDMISKCQESGGNGAIIYGEEGRTNKQDLEALSSIVPFPVMIGKQSTLQPQQQEYSIMNENGDITILGKIVTIGMESSPIYTYKRSSGTSMAAAHVTAAAAIVWSQNRSCNNHQIRYALAQTATNNGNNCNQYLGYGVVQVQDALDWLAEHPCDEWDVPEISMGGCTTL